MIEAFTQEPAPRVVRFRDGLGDERAQATYFEVRVGTTGRGRFEQVRDAIGSARMSKNDHPLSRVCVADLTTGQIVAEIEL